MIASTMQDAPLTVSGLFKHGRLIYGDSQVVTFLGEESRRTEYSKIGPRATQLAAALRRLGAEPGDRIGTFCWNSQEHLEAYMAVPSMGCVLHTLNIRLFADQLTYVINHAEDKIILVDDSLVPALARIAPELKSVRQ